MVQNCAKNKTKFKGALKIRFTVQEWRWR